MSTRAQILVYDKKWGDKVLFYKHSDGYPEGVQDDLDKFVGWMKDGKIRDNVEQSTGWLIVIGHRNEIEMRKEHEELGFNTASSMDWKVGCYEPAVDIHGDIEHFYVVDTVDKKWFEVPMDKIGEYWDEGKEGESDGDDKNAEMQFLEYLETQKRQINEQLKKLKG